MKSGLGTPFPGVKVPPTPCGGLIRSRVTVSGLPLVSVTIIVFWADTPWITLTEGFVGAREKSKSAGGVQVKGLFTSRLKIVVSVMPPPIPATPIKYVSTTVASPTVIERVDSKVGCPTSGLNVTETPGGSIPVMSITSTGVPIPSFTMIMFVPVPPWKISTTPLVGISSKPRGGPGSLSTIVRSKVSDLVRPPPLAETVTVRVVTVAVSATDNSRIEDKGTSPLEGLKECVTPEGRPVSSRETLSAHPPFHIAVMAIEEDFPCTIVILLIPAKTEKSNADACAFAAGKSDGVAIRSELMMSSPIMKALTWPLVSRKVI